MVMATQDNHCFVKVHYNAWGQDDMAQLAYLL